MSGRVGEELSLLDEFRLQSHRTDTVDLAGDVVTVGGVDETNVLHLGAAFDDQGCPLDLVS
jgi:hypothetical protein